MPRIAGLSLVAVLLVGCGGPPPKTSTITSTPLAVPAPPAWEVVSSNTISALAADAQHVYWAAEGVFRRAHGGAAPAETLVAAGELGAVYELAVGDADVFAIDESSQLVAIPKTGGKPTVLA